MFDLKDDIILNKRNILKYVSQKEIFELVFGSIGLTQYYLSPFREDKNPKCFFSFDGEILLFRDFVYPFPVNCFKCIEIYYNLSPFEALLYIYNNLIKDNSLKAIKKVPKLVDNNNNNLKIAYEKRDFDIDDKNFWQEYGISSNDLISDKIVPISNFTYSLNNKNKTIFCYTIAYAIHYITGNIKIYRPLESKLKHFTNCKYEIGNIENVNYNNKTLFITKSYKDCRVLRNLKEGLNVIYFTSENSFPNPLILKDLFSKFDDIYLLFDNDEAGIKFSNKFCEMYTKVKNIILPFVSKEINDIASFKKNNLLKTCTNLLKFL